MLNKDIMLKITKSIKPSTIWDKGVKTYALELIDSIDNVNLIDLESEEIEDALLTGSYNWKDYSWCGGSLIYNKDICERLATPLEQKISKYGELPPNDNEEWLDTQARALYQASRLIVEIVDEMRAGQHDKV